MKPMIGIRSRSVRRAKEEDKERIMGREGAREGCEGGRVLMIRGRWGGITRPQRAPGETAECRRCANASDSVAQEAAGRDSLPDCLRCLDRILLGTRGLHKVGWLALARKPFTAPCTVSRTARQRHLFRRARDAAKVFEHALDKKRGGLSHSHVR
ncbi:hypothetical protein BV25DRAFT_1146845 [Artomyces pyxidatus]|uniref:Uncharacterized protein n=1 Tax=Artomyces pyxidatus TaxID=48021 RepID=A0ACB8SRQ1_9AGAM|nr:hypothetical protein BV25DRAFT_1146845 [Artomyces pyxidatus]